MKRTGPSRVAGTAPASSAERAVWGAHRLCAFLLSLGLAACGAERTVWFGPNLASRDMLRLFTNEGEWKQARESVGVFQFYAAQVGAWDVCTDCGGNDLSRLEAVEAFDKLDRWRIAVAVEAGAVKHWGCSADATLPSIQRALQRISIAGGQVRYVAMDEPLLGGEQCGQSMDVTAREVASYAAALHSARHAIVVGDIEPYPHFDAAQLVAWLDAVAAQGFRLGFFHLDVDRARAKVLQKEVSADLVTLRDACRARAIPFGVIFWGGDGLDEAAYAEDVLAWVDTVGAAIGAPDQVVFQSWAASANGRREVPVNLPESSASVWSHTRLLRTGIERLRTLD
jgi:hypothetical protein